MQPSDLGLPGKFEEYRKVQTEALEYYNASEKRFVAMAIATGGGKALLAMSLALLNEGRTVILTSTKGLQNQYENDFTLDEDKLIQVRNALVGSTLAEARTICDLRGKANYQCVDKPHLHCGEGVDAGCGKGANCPYQVAYNTALKSKVTVTNYSKWLFENKGSMTALGSASTAILKARDKLGLEELVISPVTLLIMDESHSAPGELSGFLNFQISDREWAGVPDVSTIQEWQDWEKVARPAVVQAAVVAQKKYALGTGTIDAVIKYKDLLEKMAKLKALDPNDWVVEGKQGKVVRWWEFGCVWPGKYAERYLFAKVPRVVLISATVRPKTMALLGVAKQHYDFREWDREFPKNRCPVYHVPTVKMSYKTWSGDQRKWAERIDSIIDTRLDRKGLIHTGSFERQETLLRLTKHRRIMIANSSGPGGMSAQDAVELFRNSKAPSLLVSPSYGTGYDFPGCDAEYQLITKIPFLNTTGVLEARRKELDRTYHLYVTAQELVQWCGRIMRSNEDRGESIILDDQIEWFMPAIKGMVPKWFYVRRLVEGVIPQPPPKL